MFIGIIGALNFEIEGLKALMADIEEKTLSGIDFYRGKINNADVVVAAAGVGKVNAAVCAQTMILMYNPDAIINIGVAGGFSEGLKIGDIAIADAVVEHDMDTTATGDPLGYIYGIEMVKMPCDKKMADVMEKAVLTVGTMGVERGIIASGDQFISTHEQRDKIINNFAAIAAEMEGASIGHVCTMNKVPFAVLRAISDGANDSSPVDFEVFAKTAAENSIKIISEFLKNIKEVY